RRGSPAGGARHARRHPKKPDARRSILAAPPRVLDERYAMRSCSFAHRGEGVEDPANDLDLPEHRRCKEVEARATLEQQVGDVAATHVRGGAKPRLPVSASPIPC